MDFIFSFLAGSIGGSLSETLYQQYKSKEISIAFVFLKILYRFAWVLFLFFFFLTTLLEFLDLKEYMSRDSAFVGDYLIPAFFISSILAVPLAFFCATVISLQILFTKKVEY